MSEKVKPGYQIPGVMRAVRQHKPGGPLVVETIPVPRPGPGEVLVRMIASPVNPSDLATIRGDYLSHNYPYSPGLEGSGEVVISGGGFLAGLRLGKIVACSPDPHGDGTWAEYMKTQATRTAPVPKNIQPEKGSMMLVNPMTAMAFIHLAKKGKHRAIVNNAASSALGKMLITLCNQHHIPLISIVRRKEHVNELIQLGALHVLNSQDKSYTDDLQRLAGEMHATLFLDAVAGQQTSVMLKAAPRGSTVLTYARLSGDPIRVDPGFLIKEEKRLAGFQIGNWLSHKNIFFKIRFTSRAGKLLSSHFSIKIRCTMPMEDIEEAVRHYSENMSAGKILILPGEIRMDKGV